MVRTGSLFGRFPQQVVCDVIMSKLGLNLLRLVMKVRRFNVYVIKVIAQQKVSSLKNGVFLDEEKLTTHYVNENAHVIFSNACL